MGTELVTRSPRATHPIWWTIRKVQTWELLTNTRVKEEREEDKEGVALRLSPVVTD